MTELFDEMDCQITIRKQVANKKIETEYRNDNLSSEFDLLYGNTWVA